MPLDDKMLKIFVCPETHQPLKLADEKTLMELNQRIEQGVLKDRSGAIVEEKLDQGLIRADKTLLFPIRGDIPDFYLSNAIPLHA